MKLIKPFERNYNNSCPIAYYIAVDFNKPSMIKVLRSKKHDAILIRFPGKISARRSTIAFGCGSLIANSSSAAIFKQSALDLIGFTGEDDQNTSFEQPLIPTSINKPTCSQLAISSRPIPGLIRISSQPTERRTPRPLPALLRPSIAATIIMARLRFDSGSAITSANETTPLERISECFEELNDSGDSE